MELDRRAVAPIEMRGRVLRGDSAAVCRLSLQSAGDGAVGQTFVIERPRFSSLVYLLLPLVT